MIDLFRKEEQERLGGRLVDGNDVVSEPQFITVENCLDAEGPCLLTWSRRYSPCGVQVIEFRHTGELDTHRSDRRAP